jgi:hypothetical protein
VPLSGPYESRGIKGLPENKSSQQSHRSPDPDGTFKNFGVPKNSTRETAKRGLQSSEQLKKAEKDDKRIRSIEDKSRKINIFIKNIDHLMGHDVISERLQIHGRTREGAEQFLKGLAKKARKQALNDKQGGVEQLDHLLEEYKKLQSNMAARIFESTQSSEEKQAYYEQSMLLDSVPPDRLVPPPDPSSKRKFGNTVDKMIPAQSGRRNTYSRLYNDSYQFSYTNYYNEKYKELLEKYTTEGHKDAKKRAAEEADDYAEGKAVEYAARMVQNQSSRDASGGQYASLDNPTSSRRPTSSRSGGHDVRSDLTPTQILNVLKDARIEAGHYAQMSDGQVYLVEALASVKYDPEVIKRGVSTYYHRQWW